MIFPLICLNHFYFVSSFIFRFGPPKSAPDKNHLNLEIKYLLIGIEVILFAIKKLDRSHITKHNLYL